MLERFLDKPLQMNLELTTCCPLHCPQCYVSLNNGRGEPENRPLARAWHGHFI